MTYLSAVSHVPNNMIELLQIIKEGLVGGGFYLEGSVLLHEGDGHVVLAVMLGELLQVLSCLAVQIHPLLLVVELKKQVLYLISPLQHFVRSGGTGVELKLINSDYVVLSFHFHLDVIYFHSYSENTFKR